MSYGVWIDPSAVAETKATPGNMRQILKRAMADRGSDPRPAGSKELDWPSERGIMGLRSLEDVSSSRFLLSIRPAWLG